MRLFLLTGTSGENRCPSLLADLAKELGTEMSAAQYRAPEPSHACARVTQVA